jgi:hypothetical protein
MKIILTIFLLMFSTFAYGQDLSVTVTGLSLHAKSGFNGVNIGLGVEKKVEGDLSVAAGVFTNSIDNNSVYVAGKYKVLQINDVSISLMAGGVTGYKNAVTPFILPEICFQFICGVVVPPINNEVVGAAAFYLKIPVN